MAFSNELEVRQNGSLQRVEDITGLLTWIWWTGVGRRDWVPVWYSWSVVRSRKASSFDDQLISWMSPQSNGSAQVWASMVSMWIRRSWLPSRRRTWLSETSSSRQGLFSSNRLTKFLPRPSSVCSKLDAVSGRGGGVEGDWGSDRRV